MACHLVLEERPLLEHESTFTAHLDLEATPRAAPLARQFIRDALADLPAGQLADVLLLATELVTNVILHARTRVHLGVTRDPGNILVTVQDRSPATPAERARNAGTAHLEESGRGMAIIATLADDFGWRRLPDHSGKVMWFVVGTPARTS